MNKMMDNFHFNQLLIKPNPIQRRITILIQNLLMICFERTYGGDIFFVLSLFYPELDYFNQNFHVDHLHPQTLFKQKNSEYSELISRVSNNWNKLGNLQLLNSELNTVKK